MKDEEFYSTIKIVTGEEIVAKVIYLEDEDKVMLEDPLLVEVQRQRKGALEIAGFAFKEWMSATFEDMFVMNREHIVTMSEIDPTIKEFYIKTLERMKSGQTLANTADKLPRKSGYVGSESKFKKSLEDIFKRYEPEIVGNLAAQAGVRYSLKNPQSYINSNLVGFSNLLESCRQFKIKNFTWQKKREKKLK